MTSVACSQTIVFLTCCCTLLMSAQARLPYRPPTTSYTPRYIARRVSNLGKHPLVEDCKEKFRDTTLDHFSWAVAPENKTTYRQRYFLCDKHWANTTKNKGPIFFYVGNEADVTLYLNASGLMWESAAEFGALLVFAEHRYYGKSKPYEKTLRKHMQFLTSEQAMADYAELLTELKQSLEAHYSPVIGFGGSYGGMLGTWFRIKYPHIVDGIIAGSAPIWDFIGEDPPADFGSFAKIVTRDATPKAGAAAQCAPNMRLAWKTLFSLGKNEDDRKRIHSAMSLCPEAKLKSNDDVWALAYWLQSAFDYLAMGNYPYPSSYILNGIGVLPAFPMRVACDFLAEEDPADDYLLVGLAQAAGVFYNYSHELPCFNYSQGANEETDEDANFWDFQWCSEMFMPMTRDGKEDMFWPQPFDEDAAIKQCQDTWGVTPRPMWPEIAWGGRKLDALTNVVFSNGLYDPWSGGGVLKSLSDSVVSVIIPEGAHHLDLMFSNPLDPAPLKAARVVERANMKKWIDEAYAHHLPPHTEANDKEIAAAY